jgi:tRNA pseudouridine55 synthase
VSLVLSAARGEDPGPAEDAARERGATPPPQRDGVLAIDKPVGVTSHDVVAEVRRRLHQRRAGHLGTLDPAASGLLVIALGAATRCIPIWQGGEKTYDAGIRFGVTTDSQDLTGATLATRDVSGLTEAGVREAALALSGELMQIPPMVSAVHHQGERLYAIARRGETVERTPRAVRVAPWEWLSFALPEARVRIRCSAGTYIRTLAHDLGEALGCGAALAGLRRLRSEPFALDRSVTLDDLGRLTPDEVWAAAGIPLTDALRHCPQLRLDASECALLAHGGRPRRASDPALTALIGLGPRTVVLCDAQGEPLALGEVASEATEVVIMPQTVFPWAVRP